jgi:hypothetical protein
MAVIPFTISGLKEAQADLERLRQTLASTTDESKAKELSKEFESLSKDVAHATDELKKMNAAGKLVGTRFDDLNEVLFGTKEQILPLTSQIGEMEDRMYQLAAAGQAGTKEFVALQGETARLRKVIIDTDKSVDLLAENRGLSVFTTGLSQVGERLLSLDFEGAAKDATAMNQAVGNLGQMGKSALTGLFQTIGQIGKAFASIGRALLMNPLFLMAAAIAGIVAIIGVLMNKLGFLQPILDAVGEVFEAMKWAIDKAVESIKAFLDWLGLTNFAAQDFASQQQDAMQKVIDRSNELEMSIGDRYDHEIRMAKIAGEDTTQKELDKQKAIIKTSEARLKAIDIIIKQNQISGKLSDEEIQKLKDLRKETEKSIRESNQEIEAINAQDKENKEKDREREISENKAAYAKMLADRKKFEQDRLNAIRQIRDLELDLMQEGIQKDLALNQEKYARLIADTLKNENLNAQEKEALTNLLRQQEFERTKEIELGYSQQLEDSLKAADDARKLAAEEERLAKEEYERERNEKQLEYLKEYNTAQLEADRTLFDARLGLASGLVDAVGSLAGKNKAVANALFAVDKALAIGEIVVSTQREIAGYASNPTWSLLPDGGATIKASYIAAAKIRAATSIATIAASSISKFMSGGGASVGGGSTGGGGGASGSTTAAQPSVNLFGQNNNANNLTSPQSVEQSNEIVVKAVVSETEVTGTQNKIKKMTESAAL